MPRLKKLNPNPPKTLKERIELLEKSLADANKFAASLQMSILNLSTLEQSNAQLPTEQKSLPPLESLEQANGQLSENALDKVKRLEKVLATAQTNPFGTTDYEIFEQNLEGMTMASLQSLAQRVGVKVWGSMPELKGDLKTAFIHTNKQGNLRDRPAVKTVSLHPSNPKHLRAMQALGMKVS